MTILRTESGFRMLNGSLGLRPNSHQIEKRVEGHIFISILACHLLYWARQRPADAGVPRDWKTLRRLLGTHSLVTTRDPATAERRAHHHPAQTHRAGRRAGARLQTPRHRRDFRVSAAQNRNEKNTDLTDMVVPFEGNPRFHKPSRPSVRNLG